MLYLIYVLSYLYQLTYLRLGSNDDLIEGWLEDAMLDLARTVNLSELITDIISLVILHSVSSGVSNEVILIMNSVFAGI